MIKVVSSTYLVYVSSFTMICYIYKQVIHVSDVPYHEERRNPKPHQCWIELFSNNNILNEIDTDSNMQHDCHYIVK